VYHRGKGICERVVALVGHAAVIQSIVQELLLEMLLLLLLLLEKKGGVGGIS